MSAVTLSADAKDRLVALENEHGQLTPDIVVEDAKQKDSPLHSIFDWNARDAAEKWWLHQARAVINSFRIEITHHEHTVTVPRYVRDPSVPAKEQGYVSVYALQKDPEAALKSILLECSRAESALTRARALAEVLGLQDEIDALLTRVVGLRETLAQPTAA